MAPSGSDRRPGDATVSLDSDRRPGDATVSLDQIDAWIFDLDGVLTDTASLHERVWSQMFASLFGEIEAQRGGRIPAFTPDDYRRLVDGEARMDGVLHVLADRGITLPPGDAEDGPGTETVWALANDKDARYLALLAQEGPRPFATSVELLHRLRADGIDVAVVSASRHCAEVLEAAGLTELVDARVDGQTAAAMGLRGKPDPALFWEAARRLGVAPSHAVVVEDAIAGVEAGARGKFATVVAVDRAGQAEALRRAGGDVVVGDLGELDLTGTGPAHSPWRLTFEDPSPHDEGTVEALCTLGNGLMGTRGARPWAGDDGTSYPGTYLAGVYNRLKYAPGDPSTDAHAEGASAEMEVESLVNVPNWLALTFAHADGQWLGEPGMTVSRHHIRLDTRHGILLRRCTVTDASGRHTAVVERRVVSMAHPHLAAVELSCTPLDWSGTLEFRSALDGTVLDDETVEDRLLPNRHLELVDQGVAAGDQWLRMRTTQSQIVVAMAARTRITSTAGLPTWTPGESPAVPRVDVRVETVRGARVTIEETVAVFTSRDRAISEPLHAATETARDAPNFDELVAVQRARWESLWRHAAVTLGDHRDSSAAVNLHLFHVLQVASPHVVDLDVGLGARGLHGEGYRGHVFWDTLFAFPVLGLRLPEVSQSLLRYRSRRLPEARRAATAVGHPGAMFPWQSGSDGRDETPVRLFNPRSGRWMADRSRFQRHVGLAVAYEAWQHWQITGDRDFLAAQGAELIFEVARFFASLASWDSSIGRHRIAGVVGPDEFHDGYPWSPSPGITDNTYTNVMASWLLTRAIELHTLLADELGSDIPDRLGIDAAELRRWDDVAGTLHVPVHQGVLSQFEGYERLEPFDLDAYRARYGDIGRLDLILEAENDAVNRYQVAKQADVLMLLYLLSAEELRAVLGRLGHPLAADTIRRTITYYTERVTHGSTLSNVVHAWVLARADRPASWQYLQAALRADMVHAHNGSTREGIHLGAMAGTVDILQRCYTGLEVRDEALWFNPLLPTELDGLRFDIRYRHNVIAVDVDQRRLRLRSERRRAPAVTVMVAGEPITLRPGRSITVDVDAAR